jgi:ferredoxin-NADP reductase
MDAGPGPPALCVPAGRGTLEPGEMPSHTLKLIRHETVAEGTFAFHFERPAGFAFKAGQYLDVTLIDPPETDAEGNVRAFSIASAPHEPEIMIATRLRDSAFKRVLRSLAPGAEAAADGPFGNLVLHNNASRPAVLLAGGIGITPFRSICFRAAAEKLPHRIYLFYSNRRPEDAAFLEPLAALERENPNFRLIPTMTAMDKSSRPWSGETGYIGRAMLERHSVPLSGPIFYIAGPPAMVAAMQQMLAAAGVDSDDVRPEEFGGY